MAKLFWSERLSVGVPELDEDHKTLIDIINALRDDAEAGEASAKRVSKQLNALIRYAETHFAREERVMSVCGYKALPEHHEEHEDFVAKITEVARRFRDDPEGSKELVGDELLEYLENWLIKHILVVDMDYKPLVQGKREASEAAQSLKGTEITRIVI
jgi:hemerythrin-like metal-binding protein